LISKYRPETKFSFTLWIFCYRAMDNKIFRICLHEFIVDTQCEKEVSITHWMSLAYIICSRQFSRGHESGRGINNFYGAKMKIEISLTGAPFHTSPRRFSSCRWISIVEVDALTLRYTKFIFRDPRGRRSENSRLEVTG